MSTCSKQVFMMVVLMPGPGDRRRAGGLAQARVRLQR